MAYYHCLEVGSIGKPLLINLEDAVVVGLPDHVLGDRLHAWVVSIEDGLDGVVIVNLG